jgi:DNA-binding SARP family transcriptional activator/pimeloyl-ACP methyl ester carboxylesterase
MGRAHLLLFGGLEIGGDAEAQPSLTRKARAMLAYLALQSGHSQSREKLAALLWGTNAELQARVNLRQTLSALRKAMPSPNGGRFRTDGDRITLNLDDVDIDVSRFEALAAGTTPQELEQAISLYRGDLLDGFSLKEELFEDWLRIERERLRATAVAALEKLVVHYSTTGDLTNCARSATRLLAFEPLREDIHRTLMRTYSAQDRFGVALKQYEICRDTLKRELGLQPELETRRLYEALRSRRMSPADAPYTDERLLPPPDVTLHSPAEAGARRPSVGETPRPPTHYVKSGGCNIAYQVTGDGPIDMIYVPGWVSNLDYHWASQRVTHVFERLGSFCRLIRCDKRGTGLSDRNVGFATLEQRIEDVRAVLDAVGSKRTVVFGSSEGGNMCMLFAAAYPERTAALILHGAYAKGLWSEDYPWAKTRDQMEEELAEIERHWGQPFDLSNASPSLTEEAFEREWFATFLRNSASPTEAIDLWRWSTEMDVRPILPSIRVPTLIVQITRDRWIKVEEGRYLAKHIPSAKYLELESDDHVIWGEHSDRLVDEIRSFLAGLPHAAPRERILATVLLLKATGARSLRRYDDQIRTELRLAEGEDIKDVESGYLATFRGPTKAIQFAMAIRNRLKDSGFRIRAAVHTGEWEERTDYLEGPATLMTSRLIELANEGEIIASRTVRDLMIGSDFVFTERGEVELEGVSGRWPFYHVLLDRGAAEPRSISPATRSSSSSA